MPGPKTNRGRKRYQARKRSGNEQAELDRAMKTASGEVTVTRLDPEVVAAMIAESRARKKNRPAV